MHKGEIFNSVAMRKRPSNYFDLSHDFKLSLNMGKLIPALCEECIPGDTWKMKNSCLVRLAPMLAPVMHKAHVKFEWFFVPNRLLWDNWELFVTGGDQPLPLPTEPAFPTMQDQIYGVSSLGDYLGFPTDVTFPDTDNGKHSAMPFSGYQFIYNEYYRDQNLIDSVDYKLANGDNQANNELLALRDRAYMHDYFTSALPWAQKGDPVEIPVGTFTDVDVYLKTGYMNDMYIHKSDGTDFDADGVLNVDNTFGAAPQGRFSADQIGPNVGVQLNPNGGLAADTSSLSSALAVTINDLRRSEALQSYLEANARGGTRYVEWNLVQFGVRSNDARLQRPEFIGGSSARVVFSEVLQTSATDDTITDPTPQGNMAGHGISAGESQRLRYFCQEHGWMYCIMSVLPVTGYYQGLPRKYYKLDKFDYAIPLLANLGEQEILNQELYWEVGDNENRNAFGYTPRYSEYKYLNDRVSGDFRTSLDFWHMARKFSARPVLDQSFVECNFDDDGINRIFAVEDPTVDHLYSHVMFDIACRRVLPRFGIPTI